MSSKNEFTEVDQIVTKNAKCCDVSARDTCQQLYKKVLWLAASLDTLDFEWPVTFRTADRKHDCVLALSLLFPRFIFIIKTDCFVEH